MTARGGDASAGGNRPIRPGPWIRYAFGLVVAGLLVYAVVVASGGMEQAIDQVGHASLGLLPLALVLESCSFALIGVMLRMLRGPHRTLRWGTTVRVALVLWGLGGLLPASPAEGIAMAAAELRRRGVSRRESIMMFAVAGWFQLWALAMTAAAAAAVVSIVGHTTGGDADSLAISAVVLVAVTLAAIAIARRPAIGGYLWAATWWLPRHRGLTRAELRAAGVDAHGRLSRLLGDTGHRLRLGLTAVAIWVTDAACLWTALRAVHVHVHFSTVLLAYVIGILASWVPLLPGGIGAVEAAVPAVLHHFGVPLAVGLAGTLLWRGFSLFLPALGGVLAYLSLRYEHPSSGDGLPEPVAPG